MMFGSTWSEIHRLDVCNHQKYFCSLSSRTLTCSHFCFQLSSLSEYLCSWTFSVLITNQMAAETVKISPSVWKHSFPSEYSFDVTVYHQASDEIISARLSFHTGSDCHLQCSTFDDLWKRQSALNCWCRNCRGRSNAPIEWQHFQSRLCFPPFFCCNLLRWGKDNTT